MNLDAAAQPQALDDAPQRPRLGGGGLVLLAGQVGVERLYDLTELHVAPPDHRFDLFRDAEGQRLRSLRQLLGGRRVQASPPHLAGQNLATERHAALLLLLLDPLPDLLPRPTGLHVRQPIP